MGKLDNDAAIEYFLRYCFRDTPSEFNYNHTQMISMRHYVRRALFRAATRDFEFEDDLFDKPTEPGAGAPLENWIKESSCDHSHVGRPCVRKLRRGEPQHRCLTCGLDDTCVMCKYCFNPDDHVGHDVFIKIGNRDDGGICDCGDPEAWTRTLHCLSENKKTNYRPLPEGFRQSMFVTFRTALDFCIDVLASSHGLIQFESKPEEVLKNTKESELDADRYAGEDSPLKNNMYALVLWNDDNRSYTDACIAVQLATSRPSSFGLMVAQHVDSYGRGLVCISDNVEQLLRKKKLMKHFTATVRSMRDFLQEEMVDEIFHWLYDMSQAVVRGCHPQEISNLIGQALLEPWAVGNKALCENPFSVLGSFDIEVPQKNWKHSLLNGVAIPKLEEINGGLFARRSTTEELFMTDKCITLNTLAFENPWDSDSDVGIDENGAGVVENKSTDDDLTETMFERLTSERVKYLIFFDIRLWRSLRHLLSDLYVATLVSNFDYKRRLGRIYADLYPQIAELYVFLDREPDASVISALSTQLFTTPSIATELMEGQTFTSYMAALYTLFTMQQIGPPSSISSRKEFSVCPSIFRNCRFGQLFHEFEFLLSRNLNKSLIVGDPQRILQMADFLSIFQGISPIKRQVDKHVEFENENWVFLFTTIPFVLQLAHTVALGALDTPFEQAKDGISLVAKCLTRWAYVVLEKLSGVEMRLTRLTAAYNNTRIERSFSGLSVSNDLVSLHHPIHAFLSWLIEFAAIKNISTLRELLINRDVVPHKNEMLVDSLLFDNTLRTMALLSQIQVGLWVRNGYTVRSQLHHYREMMLRDLAYSRDVFFAQLGLVVQDTNSAFLQLLYRWELADWSNNELFDESQAFYMLEEFLHVLTFLLTDRVQLQGLNETQKKKAYFQKEIIQCLAFRAMSYTDISHHIPDSMVCDDLFESVLRDSAIFVPPKGVCDSGIYQLKPELLEKFDSHYTHFSFVRIEEAERMINEKMAPKIGCRPQDVIHLPPLDKLTGPWSQLGRFTRCVSFARFVFDLIDQLIHCEPNAAHVESVMGKVLYLLLIAAQDDLSREPDNDPQHFEGVYDSLADMMVAPESNGGANLLSLFEDMLNNRRWFDMHIRIKRLFEMLKQKKPSLHFRVNFESVAKDVETEAERKKKRAQEMRAKVMADFKRQQEAFAKNNMTTDAEMISCDQTEDDVTGWVYPHDQCVLCRMPDTDDSIFGLMTYSMQNSAQRVLPVESPEWFRESFSGPSSLDVELPPTKVGGGQVYGPAFPPDCTSSSVVVVGCGHGIHLKCYRDYIRQQQMRSETLTRMLPEDLTKYEYLCPLCRGLNNGFMPVFWQRNTLSAPEYLQKPDNIPEEIESLFEININDDRLPSRLQGIISEIRSSVQPNFAQVLADRDYLDNMSDDVHNALLSQMFRIRETYSVPLNSSDAPCGLQPVFSAYSSTVKSHEIALRGLPHSDPAEGLLLSQLSPKTLQLHRVFTQYIRSIVAIIGKTCLEISSQCSAFETFRLRDFCESDLDPFSKLVEFALHTAPIYAIHGATILRVFYIASILQFFQQISKIDSQILDNVEASPEVLPQIALDVIAKNFSERNVLVIQHMLARHVTIFLRRAALLVFGLCGVFNPDDFAFMNAKPEHERLCLYLQQPTLPEMLVLMAAQKPTEKIAMRCLGNAAYSPLEYAGEYRLLRLPERLDSFFNLPEQADKEMPADPGVCLLCGHMIEIQDELIATTGEGPCNEHMLHDHSDLGIFLLPRRNRLLLLLRGGRGTFTEGPFLNHHGESNDGLRRGRPLFLQPKRYEALVKKMWIENDLPSFIARRLDQNADFGGWETL